MKRSLTLLVALLLLASACSGSTGQSAPKDPLGDPGDCEVIDVAVSSEKIALFQDLASSFNDSKDAKIGSRCEFVRPYSKASGGAATLLANGWPDESSNGPKPEVWSPASSAWAAIVNQRLADQGEAPIANDPVPFMLTPLVIAMPKPMADALGYPDKPVGFSDILALATDPAGWGKLGH